MKKDNLIRSYALTVILIIMGIAIGQFVMQQTVRTNKNDARFIKLAQLQATLSERIAKNAILISTIKVDEKDNDANVKKKERKFNGIKKLLEASVNKFKLVHKAITRGESSLGLTNPQNSKEILALHNQTKTPFQEIRDAALEIVNLKFSDPEKELIIIRANNNIFSNQRRFSPIAREIANQYEKEAGVNKKGFINFQYIIFAVIVSLLILQAFFVFRPTVNLAYKNFLTANEGFVRLQKSEEELRKSAEKQLEFNEKLLLSQRALEERNKRLKLSESEILQSSRKQIAVNEKLIKVQEELRKAFDRVKYSEERMRGIAEEQLEATEKLMIAENKLKSSLDHEVESKNDLQNTLENLKSTQSQLVQQEKMASLGQLTAGIAHEINNPINFVYNGIDTLNVSIEELLQIVDKYDELEKNSDYKEVMSEIAELKDEMMYDDLLVDIRELVGDIKKGAVRTIEIVKGLRVFSRLDEEEMKPAQINDALDATLVLLRNKTKNRINVKKFYDKDIDEINCFPGQLNQVFMNILNNAIQAIPEERKDGEIQIYTENQEEHIMIKLKDNGSGMSDQVKRRIFEPFYTTKAVGIGTGLGMSISFGIIEKHGGNIYVTSEEGKGTEFSILIPKNLNINKAESETSKQSA